MFELEGLWKKISASINYHIKDIWREDLVKSNEELLEEYLSYFRDDETGKYEYLNKQTLEYIELSDPEVDKIKKAFIERIEKKKVKYADQIEVTRQVVEEEKVLQQLDQMEKDKKLPGFKVIELKK